MNTVVIAGASGQLAQELCATRPPGVDAVFLGRDLLDISDRASVDAAVAKYQPQAIINAAAYTAVDKAESDQSAAFAVNAQGVENLAVALPKQSYLLHISTDFVFDGSANRPYTPDSEINPMSVYGRSKAEGETRLAAAKTENWAVIRTSWVYSAYGANFVKNMLKYMQARDELSIVVDQVGSPTWAKGLASACWLALAERIQGVFHWSDAGAISWFDFAHEIQRLGVQMGLIESPAKLKAIPTEGYPLPAARPHYSVLDTAKIEARLPELEHAHWQENLEAMLRELIALQATEKEKS